MFDCAACYGNEDQIGEVFEEAFKEGVVERKDLYIISFYFFLCFAVDQYLSLHLPRRFVHLERRVDL